MQPVNDNDQLIYRIGVTDREIGTATGAPDGFIVLNLTNGNTFEAASGLWTAGGAFDPDLLAAWWGTTDANLTTLGILPKLTSDGSLPTENSTGGLGYRIGVTDRDIGGATGAPDGFVVLNTTNGNTFEAASGLWTAGGAFDSDLLDAWNAT